MGKVLTLPWLPIGIAALVFLVLLLCYALLQQTTSPLVSVTQTIADLMEGFGGERTTSPQCPGPVYDADGALVSPAYTFYTDATGESLCCAGTVNPLTHTCKPSVLRNYTSQDNMVRDYSSHITITGNTAPKEQAAYNASRSLPTAKAVCSAIPTCTAFVFASGLDGNRKGEAIFYTGSGSPTFYRDSHYKYTLYTATSSGATGSMCAFRPGVPDPRTAGQTLPLCASVTNDVAQSNGASICPPSLPKYATTGTQQSCCKTATNFNGTDCIQTDLDRGTFCRTTPTNNEPNCAAMKSLETAVCPPTLQKTSYTLGDREARAYRNAKGLSAPLCFGVEGSCFPDQTVADLRRKGVFTREPDDPTKWKFACAGFSKYQSGQVLDVNTTYLTPP